MAKCPHCEKEISYAAREQGIDKKGFKMPLMEISCSECNKVINVVIAPDYYLDTPASLQKRESP